MKMKIALKDIHDSPFRNFDRNPPVQERVDGLKASIESTGFWDNVMVRHAPDGDGYQLAYGHHRLIAVRQAKDPKTGKKYTHINIPCKDISDANMIKMMADENLNQWGHSTTAILEAVEGARDFLESGLSVCETVDDFCTYCAISTGITRPNEYTRMQNQGIGSPTIIKFFGKSWSSQTNAVTNALKTLNAGRDLLKAELAEKAATNEAIAAEKLRKEQEATRKAEEAKSAAAAEAKAKAEAAKAKAIANDNTKAQAKAKANATAAAKAKREADAKAKRAATAAAKASRTADVKRKAAAKAHGEKHRVQSRPSRDTFEGFKTIDQASAFTTASMRFDMTASERVQCGAYVIKQGFSRRQIESAVQSWFARNTVAGKKAAAKAKEKAAELKGTSLDAIIAEINATIPALAKRLAAVEPYLEHIQHAHIKKTFETRILDELAPPVSKLVTRLHALSAIADSINPSK